MAKKKTTEKALNIDNILFNCRDYLRAARNSGSFFEKRDMMLTLVFLRFIGEKYEDGIENLKQTLKEQGLDPEDENIRAAFFDDATFADGTYNLPPEARWSTIISTPAPQLNVALYCIVRYRISWNLFQTRKGKKSNMAKKKTTEKALNIDNILFNCRDYLRAARNSGSFFEKRDMMLTLVFLRFIGEKYEDGIENLKQTLKEQGLDPEDENIRAAFFDDATFADGTYNLPPEARWSTIISTPAPQLNVALDTALQRLEEEDPQLKGCFVKGTFTARNLAANDIKKIVDEVNKISHKTFGEEKDLIGRVYEYFLKEFAVNATKEEGEFYTPHDVVQLIAMMIEPYDGTLYDPCCGSGGMFIQSAELVKSKQGNLNGINVYGQEKEPATYRLAKMNLALRGISHNLGEEADSSFTHDLH